MNPDHSDRPGQAYETARPDEPTVTLDVPEELEQRRTEPLDDTEFPYGGGVSGRRRPRFERLKPPR